MSNIQDKVVLTCFDKEGNQVHDEEIELCSWYDDLHDVIDSDEFIRRKRIYRTEGKQYDNGVIDSFFKNIYDEKGNLIEMILFDKDMKIIEHEIITYVNGHSESKYLKKRKTEK